MHKENWKFYLALIGFGLAVVAIPVAILYLMDGMLSNVSNGTDDGWLGFWGGYLGAIITILGVFIQIRLERKADNERIKAERVADLQKKSLESLLLIMNGINDSYQILNEYYKNIQQSEEKYSIDGNNLSKMYNDASIEGNAKDFALDVANINYKKNAEEISESSAKYDSIRSTITEYKINQLAFFPFSVSQKDFANVTKLSSVLDNLIDNLQKDFWVSTVYITIVGYYETYSTDYSKSNVIANLDSRMLGPQNIVQTFDSLKFNENMLYFTKMLESLKEISSVYVSKISI
ncbi:hypothetical protein [Lactobacillus plantarum] [Lactiplantibacillus mudanjiangensis]|uniref:hypothetical protein n=1 Tax=Lactiplantibacillus mudanjiangensis TaxID=1296538 RepID=UPI001013E3C2|nr:hypothetical protein [Lactobacillus plantarum] [Lactiplantibacillus mudanjiangensis]